MSHLGLICPELSGHLNPMTTLGRELQRRGHRVTLIARPDARIKVESRGLEFSSVGDEDFPAGSMARTTAQLGQLGGFSAIRFTAELLRRAAATTLEEAPEAIRVAGIEGLLLDQVTNRCAIRAATRIAPACCVDDHACRAKYCARVPGTGSPDGRDSNYERSTGSCESFGVVGCCGSYPAITPHCFASSRKSAAGLRRAALPRQGAAMEGRDRSCRGSLASSQHR